MTHAAHHPDDEAVDRFAAELKAKLADARAKGRGGWEDKAQVSAQALSDMLLAHVFKGDPRDVANFAMFLHQRGESIALADGPRMEHAVEVFQIAEQRCAEHHAGAGRLIEPGIAVQAGLIAAAPFLIGASPAPVAKVREQHCPPPTYRPSAPVSAHMTCPKCGSRLNFKVTAEGHTSGRCVAAACIRWSMQ